MVQEGWSGRIIDGRYAVEAVIGAGGMGLVLKAHHKFTGAEVAVKVLKNDLASDPEVQARFLAEARAPNAIGHPGIVSVLDAGKAPDGLLYLVMELLQGRPLRIPLARGELGAADARRILLELLDALSAAHGRGFVHRDLKPENVFLSGAQQQVKLLDFGIAKVLDAGLARVRTATNAQLGTPAYMAPEQFHDPSGVDARADLWAVGIMAYEMLAGRLPFRADTAQAMLIAIATQEFDPITKHLPNCPPVIAQFFDRALARDRVHRFPTAVEMAMAFGALPLGTAPPRPQRSSQPIAHVATPAPVGHGAQTMATGYGTMATGAGASLSTGYAETPRPQTGPVPHVAPPTGPVPYATPYPPAQIPGTPLPNADITAVIPQGASKRAWFLGLGLASVASIAVVIIAVMATRRMTTAPGPGSGSSTAPIATQPVDAGVVAIAPDDAASAFDPRATAISTGFLGPGKDKKKVPRDAGVPAARADAGAGPRDPYAKEPKEIAKDPKKEPEQEPKKEPKKEPDPPPPPKVFSFEDQCRVGCEAAVKQCNNLPKARCVSDCLQRPKLRECLSLPLGSCNEVAICTTRAVCGAQVLQGAKTCGETASCELLQCAPGDFACGCKCAEQMSWRYAQALAALNTCAINCGFNQECGAKNCTFQANSCK